VEISVHMKEELLRTLLHNESEAEQAVKKYHARMLAAEQRVQHGAVRTVSEQWCGADFALNRSAAVAVNVAVTVAVTTV
jgi:hypothetical protein